MPPCVNDSFRVLSQQMKIYINHLKLVMKLCSKELSGQFHVWSVSLLFVVGENVTRNRSESFSPNKNSSTRQLSH